MFLIQAKKKKNQAVSVTIFVDNWVGGKFMILFSAAIIHSSVIQYTCFLMLTMCQEPTLLGTGSIKMSKNTLFFNFCN